MSPLAAITPQTLQVLLVMPGASLLSYAIQQYLVHYHAERNHRGLGNQLITPEPERSSHGGAVVRQEHLGRLLHYSYREAA